MSKRRSPYDNGTLAPKSKRSSTNYQQKHETKSNDSFLPEMPRIKPHNPPPTQEKQQMSIEALEQKKMLLPYLDQIEYINLQLRERGLLGKSEQVEENQTSHRSGAGLVSNRSIGGLPMEETRSMSPVITASPSPIKLSSTVIKSKSDASKPSSASSLPSSTASSFIGIKRSEPNQEDPSSAVATGSGSNQCKRVRISAEILSTRYPRFCATVENITRLSPRERPIYWLLKTIEQIYDALTEVYIINPIYESILNGTLSGANAAILSSFNMESINSPRDLDTASTSTIKINAVHSSTKALMAATADASAKITMPFFVRKYFVHCLGLLPSLADQDCLDLVYNLELYEMPQVVLFGFFLREIYDEDILLFFLFQRHVLQDLFEIQLKTKNKQKFTTNGRKYLFYQEEEIIEFKLHPDIPDGHTRQILLTQRACEEIFKTLFRYTNALRISLTSSNSTDILQIGNLAAQLAKFMTQENVHLSKMVAEDFLTMNVNLFRNIEEDLVAQFKFNDDGESLTNLSRLKETITNDQKVIQLTNLLDKAQRQLKSMRIEFLKMERSNNSTKMRTQILLLTNQIQLQEQEVAHLEAKIHLTSQLIDTTWYQVLQPATIKVSSNSMSKNKLKSKPFEEEEQQERESITVFNVNPKTMALIRVLRSVLGRFEAFSQRLMKRHTIQRQAAALIGKTWQEQMEELKLKMVVRLQRAFRQRFAARQAQAQALESIAERKKQRQLKREQEEKEREHVEKLQQQAKENHLQRLKMKQQKEVEAIEKKKKKEQELIEQVRLERMNYIFQKKKFQEKKNRFERWIFYCDYQKKIKLATKMFVKYHFLRWKQDYHHFLRFKQAVSKIQFIWKKYQKRQQFKRMIHLRQKKRFIANKFYQKMLKRMLNKVFTQWYTMVHERVQLKAKLQQVLLNERIKYFNKWVHWLIEWNECKLKAVMKIQRVYRGKIAREIVKWQRKRNQKATEIQRIYRGYIARKAFKLRLQIYQIQTKGSRALLQRLTNRLIMKVFLHWHFYVFHMQKFVKKKQQERQMKMLHVTFHRGFKRHVVLLKEERARHFKKLYDSACRVQRNYRRVKWTRAFQQAMRLHRASKSIQKCIRGYLARQRFRISHLKWKKTGIIQRNWRRHQAQKLAHQLRGQHVLTEALKGDYSGLKKYLEMGFYDVHDVTNGNTTLHLVAVNGSKRLVKLCLRYQMNLNAINFQGQTPLHMLLALSEISLQEKIELASYMIDKGAWQEASDYNGLTPLLLCSAMGFQQGVSLLLEREANVAAMSQQGKNAAVLALENNFYDCLDLILDKMLLTSGGDPKYWGEILHYCAKLGFHQCMRVFLSKKPYQVIVNERDDEGYTALHHAVWHGHVETTALLLENDANSDLQDYFGRTPLHFAIQLSHAIEHAPKAVEEEHAVSLSSTIKTCELDENGTVINTTSQILLIHGQKEPNHESDSSIVRPTSVPEQLVALLTKFEADVSIKDTDGDTPLHVCSAFSPQDHIAKKNQLPTVQKQKEMEEQEVKKAKEAYDKEIERLGSSSVACGRLLLRHGAQASCWNAVGNGPSHVAARFGHVEMLKMLVLEYSADLNMKNFDNKTPLGMARMYRQHEIVQFIQDCFANDQAPPIGVQVGVPGATKPLEFIVTDKDKQPAIGKGSVEPPTSSTSDQIESAHDRSHEEWEELLSKSIYMGSCAEWSQYVIKPDKIEDPNIITTFYMSEKLGASKEKVFSMEIPLEFMAAIGEEWEIQKYEPKKRKKAMKNDPSNEIQALFSGTSSNSTTDATQDQVEQDTQQEEIKYIYENKITGAIRETVPPINLLRLQEIVQSSTKRTVLRAKIQKTSANTLTTANAMSYKRFYDHLTAETSEFKRQRTAAITIQRHFRARQTFKKMKILLHENSVVIELQRIFRGRQARKRAIYERFRHAQVTKIIAIWRGFYTRKLERTRYAVERKKHLKRRLAALRIQCIYRGHQARHLLYRETIYQKKGPKSFFQWEKARKKAFVRKKFKIWEEMELVDEFPNVFFYVHTITKVCSWQKPKEWLEQDRLDLIERKQLFLWGYTPQMEKAAKFLQAIWRSKRARISFQSMRKAIALMANCEMEYLQEPQNLIKMANYVLFLHAIKHDYERARPLYARLYKMMAQRGPDVAFILFSYGIFLYITQEEDILLVEEMIQRGKQVDKQLIKYKTAFIGFFRQSLVQNPQDAQSNLNYAACMQWLYNQYEEAKNFYLKAISLDPHNAGILMLFNDMLQRKRKDLEEERKHLRILNAPAKAKAKSDHARALRDGNFNAQMKVFMEDLPIDEDEYDGLEVFRKWQLKQAHEENLQRQIQYKQQSEKEAKTKAASKIQGRFRKKKALKQVEKLRVALRMKETRTELNQQKQIYQQIAQAFNEISDQLTRQEEEEEAKAKAKAKTEADAKAASVSGPNRSTTRSGATTNSARGTPAKEEEKKSAAADGAAVPKRLSLSVDYLDALFSQLSIGTKTTKELEEAKEKSFFFKQKYPDVKFISVMDMCNFSMEYEAHKKEWRQEHQAAVQQYQEETNNFLPNPWEQHADDSGRIFYYNPQTDQSTWEKPPQPSQWQQFQDDHGNVYYYNPETGQTSWT